MSKSAALNSNGEPTEGEDRNPDLIDHALIATAITAANAYALARKGLQLIRGGIRIRLGAKPAPEAESLDT
ncbi:MAG: hypothetical protein WCT36_00885 [Candidatus Gracilibacteria bacterium]|jgi:hypothetical protein